MSDETSDDKDKKPAEITLDDDQIERRSRIGRRTFVIGAVGGTTALAGCVSTGITDGDMGAYADPVGAGRGTVVRRVSGITDSDVGIGSDPVGDGRGRVRRASGITDSDVGPGSDPVGNGRGRVRRSCTDSDVGPYITDPVGRGRRC